MTITRADVESPLVAFFRGEGHHLGWQGDQYGWTPEQTAIKAMRELLRLNSAPALPQIEGGRK